MPTLSFSKTLIAVVLQVLILAFIFLALIYYRLSLLGAEEFRACPTDSFINIQNCAYQVTTYYLTETTWLARLVFTMIVPAFFISYFLSYQGIQKPLLQTTIIGSLASLILLISLDNSILVAASCLLGSLLAGLMAHRRLKKIIIFNSSEIS